MAEKLTSEQVRAAVQRFWLAFESKDAAALAAFYAHQSTVFGSESARAEPGRLAAARREREYFHRESVVRAAPAAIEVVLLGERAAVASYNFKFHARHVAGSLGKAGDETIDHGRATQVFELDSAGSLVIVHEHLSLPAR